MRISADVSDSGYRPPAHRYDVRILLDGEEVSSVISADEEQGHILRAKRNDLHLLMVENGELVTEELSGKVEINAPRGDLN